MKCIEDLKNKTTPPPQDEQCAWSKCCIFSLKSSSSLEESVNLIPPGSGTGHRVVPRSKHWQCNSHCAGPAHPLWGGGGKVFIFLKMSLIKLGSSMHWAIITERRVYFLKKCVHFTLIIIFGMSIFRINAALDSKIFLCKMDKENVVKTDKLGMGKWNLSSLRRTWDATKD